MGKASDNVFPKVITAMQTVDQAAPSDSSWKMYAKAGGIYARSSNAVVGPFGASSGSTLVGSRVIRTAGDLASKNSTTFATLDATLAITVTTGAHSVLVGVVCTATIDTAPQSICLDVDLDGSRLGQTFGLQAADVNHNSKAVNLSFVHMTAALSAASHTFTVKYRVTGANGTFYASTGVTPFVFWVQELPF